MRHLSQALSSRTVPVSALSHGQAVSLFLLKRKYAQTRPRCDAAAKRTSSFSEK